jgi:transposase-like protein
MGRVEVITGPERRRRWTEDQKRAIVAESLAPGAVVNEVARRAEICPGQIYRWRRELQAAVNGFARVLIAPTGSMVSRAAEQLDNGRASIYVLSSRKFKSGSNGVPDVHRLGPYVKAHQRHFLQQSDYTMCLVFNQDNEWRFSEHDDVLCGNETSQQNFDLWKFNISSSERLKVLRLLDEYNLNAFSLFGSEESLMETMALRKLYF